MIFKIIFVSTVNIN